jgi:endonuclease/exonuclease/phosphatase family metal-dependent hydrolase
MTREQQKEWGNKTPQETKTKIYYDFRIKQLKQIETKIKEYENIDDWIICGDFNLNISDVKINNKDGYSYIRDNALKESDGWKDADKNNPKKSTCIGSDGTPQRLDYIFYKGALNKPVYKVEIETFDELLRHESNDSGKKGVNSFSDHSPITATWDDLQTTLTILKAKLLSLVKTLG